MAGPERFSFQNYLLTSTFTGDLVTPSQAAWPARNLLHPEEPLLVWRSATTIPASGLFIMIDMGAPRTVDVVGVVNVNCPLMDIGLSSDAGYTTGKIELLGITAQQTVNGRFNLGAIFAGSPSRRYIVFNFRVQTPNDGAAYFSCGGFWAGQAIAAPVGFRPGFILERTEPVIDVPSVGSGASARLQVGSPSVRLTANRFGTLMPTLAGDDLEAWAVVDHRAWFFPNFALFLNYGNPGQFWVMHRNSGPRWTLSFPYVDDAPMVLEETIFP